MKIKQYIRISASNIFVLCLLCMPLAGKAQTAVSNQAESGAQDKARIEDQDKVAQEGIKEREKEEAEKKQSLADFNREFNKRLNNIVKDAPGPKTRALFRKAVLDWMAYRKDLCDSVAMSYTEDGGNGGGSASDDCDIQMRNDFIEMLKNTFGGP